jgi:phage protein D
MTEIHPYSSHAPVFTVEGRTEQALARDCLRLDVAEGTLGLRTLVARLAAVGPESDGSERDLSYLDGEVVDLGTSIEVSLGPAGGERRLFRGTVSAIEVSLPDGSPPVVSVYAEDALMALRMRERTATYVDKTDAAMVEEIAREHGLGVSADTDGPTYPLVQQWEESDLSFLRSRALRLNAEIWLDGDGVLHFADRTRRQGPRLQLVKGNDLVSVDVRADLAAQRSEVEMRGWDDKEVEAIVESANGDVVHAEVSSGRTGPQVVGNVFSETALTRSRRDVLSAETARAYARAEMLRRSRGFVTVHGTAFGTPDLVPGAQLDLQRVGRPFEGPGYYVCHAHHSYDLVRGHRTRFTAERPVVTS